MDDPGNLKEGLAILDAARSVVVTLESGKEPLSEQLRMRAWIDEARGGHFAAMKDSSNALLAYRVSYDEAQAALKKAPSDASASTQVLWTCRGLAAQLAAIGHRDDALRTAREGIALASQNSPKGPDPATMELFRPRTNMWLGAIYEALARKDSTLTRRKADWAAAAESYTRASELWRHLSVGQGFPPLQAEIGDCARKAVECSHRAKTG